ncbi:MAG: serine--tRNA ligase [Bacteroidia bacterium]
MLEIQRFRQDADEVLRGLKARNVKEAESLIQQVLTTDEQWRSVTRELEEMRAEMNATAKTIGKLMGQGKTDEANAAKSRTSELKSSIKSHEENVSKLDAERQELLLALPNVTQVDVPVGHSEEDNKVVSVHGTMPSYDFSPKPHWELMETLGIVDLELGVKITGAGFPVYVGKGARLQRALISWFLDEADKEGYTEVQPPLLVNEASGFGTGQLPDKEGQMYHVTGDDLYLIPTAEVPITNLFRGEIYAEANLPLKRCGYTPCFRREAGSYGAHVRGLNRLHQFDKVEIVQVVHPSKSDETLEAMTQHVMGLLEKLGLHYRRLLLCTGDTSFASAKTFDMEVYSAAQERWLEVSSVSNFETFQATRLQLRFRGEDKKRQLAHTLNGSALALPRILASIMEQYQQADGSIVVPEVLRSYTGFDRIE